MKKSIAAFLVIGLLAGIIPDTDISAKVNPVKLAKRSAVLSVMEDEHGMTYETTQIRIKKMTGVKIIKTSYLSKNKTTAFFGSDPDLRPGARDGCVGGERSDADRVGEGDDLHGDLLS